MQPWYRLIRAAKYLGVPPWELAEQPIWWLNAALDAENIDAAVEQEMMKRARRRR
jgi:hypothetical protein